MADLGHEGYIDDLSVGLVGDSIHTALWYSIRTGDFFLYI